MPFRGPIAAVLEKFPFLTDSDVTDLLNFYSTRELKPNEYFLRAGKLEMRGAIVLQGLLRNFHTLPASALISCAQTRLPCGWAAPHTHGPGRGPVPAAAQYAPPLFY